MARPARDDDPGGGPILFAHQTWMPAMAASPGASGSWRKQPSSTPFALAVPDVRHEMTSIGEPRATSPVELPGRRRLEDHDGGQRKPASKARLCIDEPGKKQREIASKGGQSVPAGKRSFAQNRELASQAGRKGGQTSHTPRRRTLPDGPQIIGDFPARRRRRACGDSFRCISLEACTSVTIRRPRE